MSSFSFGSARSCLSFQGATSVIIMLAKALSRTNNQADLFNGIDGVAVNYIDDLILLGRNETVTQKMFEFVKEVMLFLNFKLSKKKQLEATNCGIILGLEFDMRASEIRCAEPRARDIVASITAFWNDPQAQQQSDLEHWVGQLGFLAYHSSYGAAYMPPLYHLPWVPIAKRRGVLAGHHKYSHLVLQALRWWTNLLCGTRVLWSVSHDPTNYIVTQSDAADRSYGVFDSRGRAVVGDFRKSRGEIIMFKELKAITAYFKRYEVPDGTGFVHLCDNQNVVRTINREYVKSSVAFMDEFIAFHRFCESKSLSCVAHYIKSKNNLATDLMSRGEPWLALQCLDWVGLPITELRADLRNFILVQSHGASAPPCLPM